MTTRTRYFLLASVLTLTVGIGTGLVAHYVGAPQFRQDGPDELRYLPRDAAVVASVNVQELMHSAARQRLRRALPSGENGQQEFQNETGINIESDVDRVVACVAPSQGGAPSAGSESLMLARGRFDAVKIEALMRGNGAETENYKGARLIVMKGPQAQPGMLALTLMEPGLVAFGSRRLVRAAVDLKGGGENVTANQELMTRVRMLTADSAWAVGRLDGLDTRALPPQVFSQLPAVTWFSVSGRVDAGVRGVVRVDVRDDEAANSLRDVVRGLMGLAQLQAGNRPEFQSMMRSLELGGTGKTVQLSFDVPGEVFDAISAGRGAAPAAPQKAPPAAR